MALKLVRKMKANPASRKKSEIEKFKGAIGVQLRLAAGEEVKNDRGTTKRVPRPVDAHVGSQVRMRRTMLGMSQTKIAELIGVTFQQLQKNESGVNRIGASRLHELSQILDVPVGYFFEGLDNARSVGDKDTLAKRETLELVRAYYGIKSDKVRKRLFELVKAAAKAGG